MAYGMEGHVRMSFQESYGTAFAGSFHSIPIISESLKEEIPQVADEGITGILDVKQSYEGAHNITGDISMQSHPIYIGVALKGWFGQVTPTYVADSHYSHSFKPVTSDDSIYCAVPPATIEAYRGAGSGHIYSDMAVDALTIEIANGAIVKSSISLIGACFSLGALTSPAYLEGRDFTWDQTSISVGGAGKGTVKDLSIAMSNNLEAIPCIDGTKTPARIKRTAPRSVEISGTTLFDNDDDLNTYLNQSEFVFVVDVIGPDCTSGVPGSLKMDFPSCKLTDYAVNNAGPGQIEVSATYMPYYNSGSGCMCEYTLVNTQSTY